MQPDSVISSSDINGIRYLYVQMPTVVLNDCINAAQVLCDLLRLFKPSAVVAAQDLRTINIGQQVARQLDLPIAYENGSISELVSVELKSRPAAHQMLYTRQDQKDFQSILLALQTLPGIQPKPLATLKTVGRLRIAAVMDEFTFHSYDPECELLQLHPDSCVQQLIDFKPDLLFIESAWKGFEGLWQLKISNNGPEINACIKWCKNHKVPTMFWNKEDPVHFSTFIPLAQQVDYVFTTDIDCIPKYKHAISHDRVFLLPFAAQPKTHNPIELFERKDAFNFAGSYYLRYPERQRDFAALINTVKTFKPVDIFDRNFDNPHPHYTFPDNYKPMILGKLPFEEIDKAYKGYRYGINMNTIKQSQTMFARRVFELLASNTVVISNFSRGVRLLFGDLVITSDEAVQLHQRLQGICNNETTYRKLRLMGLRKVMIEHTYAHRLAYIRAKLSGAAYQPQMPAVAVLAVADSAAEQVSLVANFQRQTYPACTLYLLQNFVDATPVIEADISTFTDVVLCRKALDVALCTKLLLAVFVAQDYYGPEYIIDLALASTYAQASAFGKVAQYQREGSGCLLQQDGQQYRPALSLLARAALVRSTSIPNGWLDDCLAQPTTASLQLPDMLATDEFHYCRDGVTLSANVLHETLEDLPLANQGVSFANALAPIAESLQANAGPTGTDEGLPQLSAEILFKLIPAPASKQLQLSYKDGLLQLQSTLPVDKHAYLYANKRFTRQELNLVLNSQFRLEAEYTIADLKTVFEFQNAKRHKISHAMNGDVGGKHALAIPNDCTDIRFGLRIQGAGNLTIQRLVLGNHGERPAAVAGQSAYLVLTKQYPAYDDLYRYGFLHSRVRAYKEHGLLVDVFRINNDPGQVYREFEGIDVASGDAQLLDDTLKTGRYQHVLVHMLDENMWRVLEQHLDKVKVTVWIHGAEIQVWQRRSFEFVNMSPEEVTRQKKLSDNRTKFWQKILKAPHPNLHLVFVSNYLRNEAIVDSKVDLPDAVCSVVSNFIDGGTFPYREKYAEDRLKLLSIRPYAKRVYANDLTVSAIVELSKRAFFKELSFTLVGDGELFDETVEPLRKFTNVSIEKRFLNHAEIAQYHQRHGVLIVPTRMDTQGVSRDEAMSSGLAPITTNVAAIPEFVDASCGIVVPAEDYKAIADGVEFLYHNPDVFLKLSKAAAERVRKQCGFKQTIEAEINLILQGNK
jgi:glycosyltransferase involved in cell wall biosynthesis